MATKEEEKYPSGLRCKLEDYISVFVCFFSSIFDTAMLFPIFTFLWTKWLLQVAVVPYITGADLDYFNYLCKLIIAGNN